jgi:hypothetical protein
LFSSELNLTAKGGAVNSISLVHRGKISAEIFPN